MSVVQNKQGLDAPLAFLGTIIHHLSPKQIEIIPKGLLIVGVNGKIAVVEKDVADDKVDSLLSQHGLSRHSPTFTVLERGEFLIPGFIDTHNHAPQWTQRGLGRGKLIMEWLNKTTFPHEAKFQDPAYARKTYASCVDGFLKQGVTTAAYYGSLHGEATKILAEICVQKGQRALVGKCNMNREAPDYYVDKSAAESIAVTEDFIAYTRQLDPTQELVTPILTPRFAVACDHDVLTGLGKLAEKNPDLPIQTHFNETLQEMEITKKLYPEFDSEADLYEHFGLLNDRSILAHCIYMDDYDMRRLKELDCGVAHCPISNTTSGVFGVAPVREYLNQDIKVGLGTDSGGGFSSSIIDCMRQAFAVSKARQLDHLQDKPLHFTEMLYLATLGGARVCSLDHKIGNFLVGKEFDALEIHTVGDDAGIITLVEDEDTTEDILEKFVMSGDDRNVAKVFVKGRSVKKSK
ncbi:guanine deaminase [Capronia coronata CBS 617.96]|uniref:Guanine deaminase n=1 Tax=Capronia coronata CBS 617.96 TaxID=1182541 RepID=W9YP98_9EURO|nr:guanine deaminase [Capronia coronata CBS 617.96]EXJ94767.1 guanine deaminase [Capronia coronata CBS 617.96]